MISRYLVSFFHNEKRNQKHYGTFNYTLFTKMDIKYRLQKTLHQSLQRLPETSDLLQEKLLQRPL